MILDTETRLRLHQQAPLSNPAIIPPELLALHPQGIDLLNPRAPDRSLEYENLCYEFILQQAPKKTFTIGPHAIDHLLGKGVMGKWSGVPDGIRFRKFAHAWLLTTLFEFKVGKNHYTKSKVEGFSNALTFCRRNPGFLPRQLRDAFEGSVRIPDKIIVPPDSQIAVVFILPRNVRAEYDPEWKFRIDYQKLQLPQEEFVEPIVA